jgi:ribosome maturation factor RimP
MADETTRLHALADPVAARHGVTLLSIDAQPSGDHPSLIRLVVDKKGGAGIDACRQISREVSTALDEIDPIGGAYTLEVTTPGTDWPLVEQSDFDRVEGREVTVSYKHDGFATEVTGRVIAAHQETVAVLPSSKPSKGRRPKPTTDGPDGDNTRHIPYADIVWAKQALPW